MRFNKTIIITVSNNQRKIDLFMEVCLTPVWQATALKSNFLLVDLFHRTTNKLRNGLHVQQQT